MVPHTHENTYFLGRIQDTEEIIKRGQNPKEVLKMG